ncbi:MAG: urease accessory protein UreD [Chloroflexi bacterium]|nr:urease accessory protein UreD [Chloroflexota bacterium]
MTSSRARLVVDGAGRGQVAWASAPQRWAQVHRAADGWTEAVHQTIGDGVFAGDLHRTAIVAEEGAALLVRGVAAVPVRGRALEAACGTATTISVARDATACFFPGSVIPQVGSDHTAALRMDVNEEGRCLAASIIVPGRTGMGERGAFTRLRVRTTARVGGRLAFLEDAVMEPSAAPVDDPAGYYGFDASMTMIALGNWAPASIDWWDGVTGEHGIGGASALRSDGACFRALFPTLGDALQAMAFVEQRVRMCSR